MNYKVNIDKLVLQCSTYLCNLCMTGHTKTRPPGIYSEFPRQHPEYIKNPKYKENKTLNKQNTLET